MRIIISPAKRMRTDADGLSPAGAPVFVHRTGRLLEHLQSLNLPELQKLLACNEEIAQLNFDRYRNMDLNRAVTPALVAYDGIQYQYMSPQVFEQSYFYYVQPRLRILSGFYGVLRPLDGVVPYRLEMQAKLALDGYKNLYQFWGNSIAEEVCRNESTVLNLASEEYAKSVRRHLPKNVRFIDCIFGEMVGSKIVEKGVYVKMARGEAVRFLAENAVDTPSDLRAFDRLGFEWSREHSTENRLVFLMNKQKQQTDF